MLTFLIVSSLSLSLPSLATLCVCQCSPIAGHANLCPDSISTKPQDLETLLSTVKHEILHALGFSVSLYAYFRDSDGKPLTPRGSSGKPLVKDTARGTYWGENVISKVIRHSWKVRSGFIKKEIHLINTPRVVVSYYLSFMFSLPTRKPFFLLLSLSLLFFFALSISASSALLSTVFLYFLPVSFSSSLFSNHSFAQFYFFLSHSRHTKTSGGSTQSLQLS